MTKNQTKLPPQNSKPSDKSLEKFFSTMPDNAIIADAFLGLSFTAHQISKVFQSYINAYGGEATIIGFRQFYNLTPRSFNAYIDVAAQIRKILLEKHLLPNLGKFSSPTQWKTMNKKEPEIATITKNQNSPTSHDDVVKLPISSPQSRDYLTRLDSTIGMALGKKIVRIDEKTATVSFPSFWLKQLGNEAIKELASELGVDAKMLRPS